VNPLLDDGCLQIVAKDFEHLATDVVVFAFCFLSVKHATPTGGQLLALGNVDLLAPSDHATSP
jgi:hypothetical protein